MHSKAASRLFALSSPCRASIRLKSSNRRHTQPPLCLSSRPNCHASHTGSTRSFAGSAPMLKKTGKANRSQARTDSTPPVQGVESPTAVDDVYDFSTLESNCLKAIEKLSHDLSRIKPAGRFNPEVLEELRVHPVKGSPETVRLSDLAQVVPKGRNISIIAGEEEHLKPISSAILNSKHNLTPQAPKSDAPTTLTVQIPPATGESRQAAIANAQQLGEDAQSKIREARQKHNKKLRAMELAKKVRPDDLQKAHKQMEDLVKSNNGEVKRIVDTAKRVLESG